MNDVSFDVDVSMLDLLAVPGDDSSGSSGSSELAPSENGSPAPFSKVRRRPIPRKGHTKSRNGCYNCKRRKVKCTETLPQCHPCKRLGLACDYPSAAARMSQPPPTNALQSTPTAFSLTDLRFFQHFILTAYPPLPMRGDAVWKDVAVISHHFDYLIHSMLGLAATHLSQTLDSDEYTSQALAHRVAAIQLVNESLGRPCASRAEGDARFATMMALTFQSAYMEEGMLDFVSMIRGCGVVSRTGMPCFEDSLFRLFSREAHIRTVRDINRDAVEMVVAPQHLELVDRFLASLRALGPLCRSTVEVDYLSSIERSMRKARTSHLEAFTELTEFYGLITEQTSDEFASFIDPENYVAQLILIHGFVMENMVAATSLGPAIDAFPFRWRITRAWVEGLAERLPPRLAPYIAWPLQFARSSLHPGEKSNLLAWTPAAASSTSSP